jgi:hypothetical protein
VAPVSTPEGEVSRSGIDSQAPKASTTSHRAKKAEERATAAERELVVNKANLDYLTPRQLAALSREHEGEWTSDLVKATAHELFGVGPTGESTPGEPEPDHADEAGELAAAATSSTGAPDVGPNRPLSQEELDKAIAPLLGDDDKLVQYLESQGFDGSNW